jgi:hypothetical protein
MERFERLAADHAEWSQKEFGDDNKRDWTGPLAHLEREIVEIKAAPSDEEEWADGFLLLLDAARRAGLSASALLQAAEQKLLINIKRRWQEPNEDGSVEHVRDEGSQ